MSKSARKLPVPTEAELAALLLRYRDTLGTRWDEAPNQEGEDKAFLTLLWQQSHAERTAPEQAADNQRPQRGTRSRGPAPATVAKFAAAFAYAASGEALDENGGPGELGRLIAEFAVKHGLDGAKAVHDTADNSTMRVLLAAALKAVRMTRGR